MPVLLRTLRALVLILAGVHAAPTPVLQGGVRLGRELLEGVSPGTDGNFKITEIREKVPIEWARRTPTGASASYSVSWDASFTDGRDFAVGNCTALLCKKKALTCPCASIEKVSGKCLEHASRKRTSKSARV